MPVTAAPRPRIACPRCGKRVPLGRAARPRIYAPDCRWRQRPPRPAPQWRRSAEVLSADAGAVGRDTDGAIFRQADGSVYRWTATDECCCGVPCNDCANSPDTFTLTTAGLTSCLECYNVSAGGPTTFVKILSGGNGSCTLARFGVPANCLWTGSYTIDPADLGFFTSASCATPTATTYPVTVGFNLEGTGGVWTIDWSVQTPFAAMGPLMGFNAVSAATFGCTGAVFTHPGTCGAGSFPVFGGGTATVAA